jgi:hypothetical protein
MQASQYKKEKDREQMLQNVKRYWLISWKTRVNQMKRKYLCWKNKY